MAVEKPLEQKTLVKTNAAARYGLERSGEGYGRLAASIAHSLPTLQTCFFTPPSNQ